METFARSVIGEMSRAEKAVVVAGNLQPASWLAEILFEFNEDQAIRVAEAVQELLQGGV